MARKGPNIRAFNKRFPDEDTCLRAPYADPVRRAPDLLQVPEAGDLLPGQRTPLFVCEHCGYQVYPTAGTPFESTRTPLRDWFYVMFLFCASRNGVAAKEVQRQLGVTYKTAWRMCNLIRKYMGYVDGDFPIGGPGKTVEADETFIGGKDIRPARRQGRRVWHGRTGGDVLTRAVSDAHQYDISFRMSLTFVKPGTKIYTDDGVGV